MSSSRLDFFGTGAKILGCRVARLFFLDISEVEEVAEEVLTAGEQLSIRLLDCGSIKGRGEVRSATMKPTPSGQDSGDGKRDHSKLSC